MPPHKRRGEYIKLGLAIALGVTVLAAATGRMHWIGAAFTGLLVAARQSLPLLIKLFPILAKYYDRGAIGQGQSSTVQSAILRMQLDHDSGELQGEVLQGHYTGWRLADMSLEQLQELLAYCQSQDADSVQLLESYLTQRFPGQGDFNQGSEPPRPPSGQMERKEALSILGLEEGASDEEIVSAHRKLMQKLHPDRGGNDYLAAKLNQAKDTLLG
jgi:DnaJ domain